MSDVRPVWLNKAQRDALERAANGVPIPAIAAAICDQWDAAPEDAIEAISLWLRKHVDADYLRSRLVAEHSLVDALGMPDPTGAHRERRQR